MAFTPIRDWVLIHREKDSEKTTAGGLIVPDISRERPSRGVVSAVGPGVHGDRGTWFPTEIKAGDEVLFGKYSGVDLEFDGGQYLMIREHEILGVVEK